MTPDAPLEHVLVEVATGLWRLRRRLDSSLDSSPDSSAPETQAAARQVRRILDVLGDADIRIDDHHGIAFEPGLAMDVVAYQETEGVTREQVIDAERPSIFRGGATLQRARVIVGVPVKEQP
jgi:hypothetical protein